MTFVYSFLFFKRFRQLFEPLLLPDEFAKPLEIEGNHRKCVSSPSAGWGTGSQEGKGISFLK